MFDGLTVIEIAPHSRQPDVVLCFDRDLTVSVNPPRDRDVVPLAWLKYFAHSADTTHIDVWATGNQRLCREAGIPGTTIAQTIWNSLQTGEEPDYRVPDPDDAAFRSHEMRRRDALWLIEDIYDVGCSKDDITFVVVDDAVLDDLERDGWSYYKPWTFADLLDEGNGPVTVSADDRFCNNPVNDPACDCLPTVRVSFYSPV